MGKFIQPNGRQAAPIFPQMPGGRQRMGSPQAPYDKSKTPKDEKPEKAPIIQKRPVPKKTEAAPKQSVSKRMTVNDLRNGFKMSVIIGEPVSRKYRRHK